MQEGVESGSQLVVSSGDATELLESVEETLDQVPGFVAVPIDLPFVVAVGTRRDIRLCPLFLDNLHQGITVIPFVRRDGMGRDANHQRLPLADIGNLPTGQQNADRVAKGIHSRMNLGSQSAPRSTDRLIFTVFLGAPAACWWARTIVESINTSSKSASPWRAVATRCQTPYCSQRENRTYTECQLPNSDGRSRQGHPVRATYRTASTNRRLSAARPPLSVGLPGNKAAIFSHWESLSMRRSIISSKFLNQCNSHAITVNTP